MKKNATRPDRTYCGKTRNEMNVVLDTICGFEDRFAMTDDEHDAFLIAIQCITTVINCMASDRPIEWDD